MKLTAKDGRKIAKKLDAEVSEGRKHTNYRVVINNKYIGRYGLSRGSREKSLYDIAKQIAISPTQAKELSSCNISKEGYVEILQTKGIL